MSTEYTAEQVGTIQFLVSEGKKINERKQELLRAEYYDQTEIDKLEAKLDEIRNDIAEAQNAKKLYADCIAKARVLLDEAARLKKKYGVGK